MPPPDGGTASTSPASQSPKAGQPRAPPLHELYALPAPIRTFPLPTFYPNNLLSLFYLVWAWTRQVLSPPPAEPSVVWEGVWSPASGSVHVSDEKAMRALWEQGFYGKGNLSRSEPNWLKREKVRRGLLQAHVSEELTESRRAERFQKKWERARAEQEAIRQIRIQEARDALLANLKAQETASSSESLWKPPVGPAELLSLPNSLAELEQAADVSSLAELEQPADASPPRPTTPGTQSPNGTTSSNTTGEQTLKRKKSVRFSPRVESTTYQLLDPPSPHHAALNGRAKGSAAADLPPLDPLSMPSISAVTSSAQKGKEKEVETTPPVSPHAEEIKNLEHLQLVAEEAFFLVFALGALKVLDPVTRAPMDVPTLFRVFRQNSKFPSLSLDQLRPDDNFLVHYAVYHHFRSLGWVPRPGIKFGMDWMLYARGPVFDHAEFGIRVMPSYTHPWWKENGGKTPSKSWPWLHAMVRVLAHVQKSLVLVYVDVPPPPVFDEAMSKGPAEVFKLYKIREVMVKRWSGNRN
ncbi:hypothetical protein ACRALDRAFT_1064641, partial [Sodiomyces alcalophilus JCM 7366]|uniref:uncharacterized protein n=1 Tax=Sodiomyces alcalophilus JCM 7366 TaxID=591952 RepID=UPI0039B5DF57